MANDLISLYDNFNIHPDLIGLLWINKGNIFFDNEPNITEPSMIDCDLPISRPKQIHFVPKLGYYPSYRNLSFEQRWLYLHFLENPYNTNADIGFVFILYYGLERHLLMGDCHGAFNVIINLRKMHKNKSFQTYSLRSLLSICLINKDIDMLKCLKDTLTPDTTDTNTVMIINALSFNNLTAAYILNNLSFFGFRKMKYVKQNYMLFEKTLRNTIFKNFEIFDFPISSYVNYPMETISQVGFANISLPQRNIEVPSFKSNKKFVNDVYTLLDETHNFIKNLSK